MEHEEHSSTNVAETAFAEIQAGNRRYQEAIAKAKAGDPNPGADLVGNKIDFARREELATNGQHPSTWALSCADSRDIPERDWDQRAGSMLVSRNAGLRFDDSVKQDVNLAAGHGVKLFVVNGHNRCGAIAQTVKDIMNRNTDPSFPQLAKDLWPLVERFVHAGERDEKLIAEACEKEHVLHVVEQVRHYISDILSEEQITADELKVVGSMTDIMTGDTAFITPLQSIPAKVANNQENVVPIHTPLAMAHEASTASEDGMEEAADA